MADINELKQLMKDIGIDVEIVNSMDPAEALSRYNFDSLDWPAFIVAVEERYKIKISDTDSLRLKTLNDFLKYIDSAA